MNRDSRDEDMRIGVLACDDEWPAHPIRKPGDAASRLPVGLKTLEALLRYGKFALDVELGVTTLAERAADIQRLRSLAEPSREIRFLSPESLVKELSAGRYDALLDVSRMRPALGAHLRERFSPKPIPYVCLARDAEKISEWINLFFPAVPPGSRPQDALLCPNPASAESYRRILDGIADGLRPILGDSAGFRGRLATVPRGVDVERFRPRDRKDLRIRLGLPEGATIALWRGRFSREACADLAPALLAVDRIRKRDASLDLRLLLCGEDPDGLSSITLRLDQELKANPALILRTVIPDFAEPLLFAASDVFVSLSDDLADPFGSRVPEAMASGLPILSMKGCAEAVEPDFAGFVIPSVGYDDEPTPATLALVMAPAELRFRESRKAAIDFNAIERSLTRLAEDEKLREGMGARSRERAEARFAWPKVIASLEDAIRESVEIAKEDRQPMRGDSAYPWFGMGSAFIEHPTTHLTEEARFALTDLGLDAMRGSLRVLPDAKAMPLFSGDLLERTFRAAAKLAWRKPARIADLMERIGRSEGAGRADIWRHLMWLLKCDLLEIRD